MIRHLTWGAVCALTLSIGLGPVAGASAAQGPVTSPVTGGNGVPVLFGHTSFELASVGYAQSEFFVEDMASAYSPVVPLTMDGRWTVAPSAQAAYKTRMVVNRPIRSERFNGTVVVEWLNVTGGVDASPDWIHMHSELVRRGFAWVGVSAQAVGVNALKGAQLGDPVRYASLAHPGDSYSYDMFSQAGQAIRDDAATVLGGLRPDRVIAVGESQSATRLVTYINAAHPLTRAYDGFLVHSRSAAGAPLSQPPLPAVPTPAPSLIRVDLNVPVLVLQTENDAGGLLARQEDSPTLRLWEVAGTAHFDDYGLRIGAGDTGSRESAARWFDSMRHPTNQPSPNVVCDLPINTGPQTYVLRAAIWHLNRWVVQGTPPPTAARLETISIAPLRYALDANGNVRGGVRTPAVDAPVARLSGLGQTGAQFCFLFGTTTPFTQQRLTALYGNHDGFVRAWSHATLSAFVAGFLRPEDTLHLVIAGAQSDIPEGAGQ